MRTRHKEASVLLLRTDLISVGDVFEALEELEFFLLGTLEPGQFAKIVNVSSRYLEYLVVDRNGKRVHSLHPVLASLMDGYEEDEYDDTASKTEFLHALHNGKLRKVRKSA